MGSAWGSASVKRSISGSNNRSNRREVTAITTSKSKQVWTVADTPANPAEVLRVKDNNVLLPEYLVAVLHCPLVLAQTIHMMTGNAHPRLTNDDVANLTVSIPSPEMQAHVADEVVRRREEARRLRAEAEAGWEEAQRWFEVELLCTSTDDPRGSVHD